MRSCQLAAWFPRRPMQRQDRRRPPSSRSQFQTENDAALPSLPNSSTEHLSGTPETRKFFRQGNFKYNRGGASRGSSAASATCKQATGAPIVVSQNTQFFSVRASNR